MTTTQVITNYIISTTTKLTNRTQSLANTKRPYKQHCDMIKERNIKTYSKRRKKIKKLISEKKNIKKLYLSINFR